MHSTGYPYCPRYCEENIWHLAQEPFFAGAPCFVAVISNAARACLFWDQRMCDGPDEPVWWDYHVILLVRQGGWLVYDLDTALPLPADAGTYLDRTFRMQEQLPIGIRPRFALYAGGTYVDSFASDRSHMRDERGGWLSPPPDWPPINGEAGEGFLSFVEREFDSGGHLSISEMYERFGPEGG